MKNINTTAMKIYGFDNTNGADEIIFMNNGFICAVVNGKKLYSAPRYDNSFAKAKEIGLNNPDVHTALAKMAERYVELGW